MVSTSAVIRPSAPPNSAPRVLSPFQYMERNSTGKLQLAAMENARPTMKAMFCFSKMMPSRIATTPRVRVVSLVTRISSSSRALPCLITQA